MEIPSGYRFLPNHRELIECYLLNKVIGERVPSNPVIDDCDLYGDPEIWSKNFEQTGMKTLYFYTRLKRMTENGKQVGRATRFGTWRSQKDDPVFDSSQRHIGSHRTFSFKPKGGLELKGSRWTMHEFRLDGVYVNTKNPNDYVICQINRYEKRGRTEIVEDNSHFECPEPVNVEQNEYLWAELLIALETPSITSNQQQHLPWTLHQ
ncbi:NAC domain-containing protein 41-like [Fagus crenata]